MRRIRIDALQAMFELYQKMDGLRGRREVGWGGWGGEGMGKMGEDARPLEVESKEGRQDRRKEEEDDVEGEAEDDVDTADASDGERDDDESSASSSPRTHSRGSSADLSLSPTSTMTVTGSRSTSSPHGSMRYSVTTPSQGKVGQPITVRFTSDANHSDTDWIGVYPHPHTLRTRTLGRPLAVRAGGGQWDGDVPARAVSEGGGRVRGAVSYQQPVHGEGGGSNHPHAEAAQPAGHLHSCSAHTERLSCTSSTTHTHRTTRGMTDCIRLPHPYTSGERFG